MLGKLIKHYYVNRSKQMSINVLDNISTQKAKTS